MYNLFKTVCLLTIGLFCSLSSHSQINPGKVQIDRYCDSLDKINDFEHIIKEGSSVKLEYIVSHGEVIKIVEHPAGYKFISATVIYYFKQNKPVSVKADVEISSEDGENLTIELHKIYLDNSRIIEQWTGEQTFNADSLYNSSSDPLKTAESIRKNARFKSKSIDQEFEKTLLQAIDKYLKASTKKQDDPVFKELSSPFI